MIILNLSYQDSLQGLHRIRRKEKKFDTEQFNMLCKTKTCVYTLINDEFLKDDEYLKDLTTQKYFQFYIL